MKSNRSPLPKKRRKYLYLRLCRHFRLSPWLKWELLKMATQIKQRVATSAHPSYFPEPRLELASKKLRKRQCKLKASANSISIARLQWPNRRTLNQVYRSFSRARDWRIWLLVCPSETYRQPQSPSASVRVHPKLRARKHCRSRWCSSTTRKSSKTLPQTSLSLCLRRFCGRVGTTKKVKLQTFQVSRLHKCITESLWHRTSYPIRISNDR